MSETHQEENRAALDREIAGRRLLSEKNLPLNRELEKFVAEFCGRKTVFWDGRRQDVPRYGIHSEVASYTPIRLYDLPELSAVVNTAFTDGSRVFFNADFFRKLLEEDKKGKIDLPFLLIHEINHILNLHTLRLKDEHFKTVAGVATDIRINIDGLEGFTCSALLDGAGSRAGYEAVIKNPERFAVAYADLIDRYAGEVVRSGYATTADDRKKWGSATAEQIGRELMKDYRKPPKFTAEDALKAAATDLEQIADTMDSSGAPNESAAGNSPDDLRDHVKTLKDAAEGRATTQGLKNICAKASGLAASEQMRDLDMKHSDPADGNVETVGDLRPSIRAELAAEAARQLLNPSAGPKGPSGSAGSQQNGDGQPDGPGEKGQGGQKQTVSSDGIGSPTDRHYMPPEDLKEILERAGAHNLTKALGYDTPERIAKAERDAAQNVEQAIRSAAEEARQSNGSYPGAHLVDAAMRNLEELHNPVITWKLALSKALAQGAGRRKTARSLHEMSMVNAANPTDLGFASAGDVPWLGGAMPVKTKKKLVVVLVDTSGSTSNILPRLCSEAINMARKSRRDTSPNVMLCFADTVVRGKPVMINERNIGTLLKNGVTAHGMGGTDFLAPIVNVVAATEKGGFLEGQEISHIVFMTDGECWLPPREHLPAKLPPVMFLVPDTHYRRHFDEEVKSSDWADAVFFNDKEVQEVDLERSAKRTSGMRP